MEPTLCDTFALPISPPKPMVVPMYATPEKPRPIRILSLHHNLPATPRYHPYSLVRRRTRLGKASGSISYVSDSPPPRTGVPRNDTKESCIHEVQPAGFTLSSSGWCPTLIRDLRIQTKAVIRKFLIIGVRLGDQDPKALEQAREVLLQKFPAFINHKDCWGIDAALRDQLKSLKDTQNARARRAGMETEASIEHSDSSTH
ncbi:hypothetical protein VNI00_015482 [Paramarasmius palmivorus]|uniref:Uncharacterized protein n=1 Tax=Paramarasmius palmivorus TaxID=297713 RepID=A0AAW0BJJ8_9AGAR